MSGERHLSTGEAARLCSVKPDTVLKWIKRGQLPAVVTAGGHHRILYSDVARIVERQAKPDQPPKRPLRCWEYVAGPGGLPEACRDCIVYRARASWCFEVVAGGMDAGRRHCQIPCAECAYYQRVKAATIKVLVVSRDAGFVNALGCEEGEGISVAFAANAYEAASAIRSLHPAFVVVDRDLDPNLELVGCIARDPAAPGLKIVLAVGRMALLHPEEEAARGITRQIVKPFGRPAILETMAALPVETAV